MGGLVWGGEIHSSSASHTGTCTEPFSCDIGDELSRVGEVGSGAGGGIVDVFGGKILHGTLVVRLLEVLVLTVLYPWEMLSNWGFSVVWLFADCTTHYRGRLRFRSRRISL